MIQQRKRENEIGKIMLETCKPIVYNTGIPNVYEVIVVTKKAEMVRRSKVVKFVSLHSKLYEAMASQTEPNDYLKGYAKVLNDLIEEFAIEADEYSKS
ncbi:hypothetical protein [Paenibacillus harenae]|uniref:Uncharacterized protein n=1 Tax=Paenibacillus harenae TaxID=306543 RepID=A0ABT9UCY5_PAEHA|nr:hypothetical protein [Paenibacillus harenae]MDQ0116828.1 hypothetical protein [Paenibacillus harenae]